LNVLITGAGGLVGTALARHCESLGDEVIGYTHQSLDIANEALVEKTFRERRPQAVINCAAWTDVDGCQLDPDRAMLVNATGPENLARASRKYDALLITISTDYVFNGAKAGFYTQRDDPDPQSVYGVSKLEGERRAQLASARTIVVRSGFIFGQGGKNFLSTVIQRARRSERLKVINDATGTFTYAPDLAARLRELVDLDLPGIFHVVNSGDGGTFEDFTMAALKVAGCAPEIETVSMASLNRPAPRPQNSRLKCLITEAIGLKPLPHWTEALVNFLKAESKTTVRS